MSDVEVRRNAPPIPSSPHSGVTEFVVDYPIPAGEGGGSPQVEAAAELQYSERETHSRRWLRRLRVPALVLLACILAASLAPRSLRHLQLLRLTSACLKHQQPADTTIYEYAPYGLPKRPADLRYRADRYSLSLVSPQWRALYELKHGSSFNSDGTAYLGRRSTRGSGLDRLVVVDVVQGEFHDSPVEFVWRLYDPGTIRSGPSAVAFGTRNVPGTRRMSPTGVRVFAGVPDPNDESHFTIDVEMTHQVRDGDKWVPQTKRHTFDGWVREKDVLLTPRDLPAPAPADPSPNNPSLVDEVQLF